MILVCMLNTDEEALVCDFAETYRIYNYKEIPCKMAAIYAKGLKENARIKMKLAGVKVTLEDMHLSLRRQRQMCIRDRPFLRQSAKVQN